MEIREALTFDDVLLKPAASSVLPAQAETRSRLTRRHRARNPAAFRRHGHGDRGAAGDRPGPGRLAMGVVHRNLDIEAQAEEVRKVKRFESGMVVNPIDHHPVGYAGGRPGADAAPFDLRHSGGAEERQAESAS